MDAGESEGKNANVRDETTTQHSEYIEGIMSIAHD